MNQLNYILRRLLQFIPTFFVIMVVVFAIVRLLPGDPASALLGDRATDEAVARINARLGLDRPLPVQFAIFLRDFFTGDLGNSTALRMPVLDVILQRMPVTLFLTGYAAIIALVLAVPLASLAALRRGGLADNAIRGAFQVGLSTPVFYLGLILLTFLGARLGWFPIGGMGRDFGDSLYHLFLPALTLALSLSAVLMRNLRSAMVEVLSAEHVDFAQAKGLRQHIVVTRHVLRNALISTVTLFGLSVGTLISGAVITESVFAVPGVGRLMIDSIFSRDYPMIQGLTLTFVLLVSLVLLLTDLVQAWLDPRVGL